MRTLNIGQHDKGFAPVITINNIPYFRKLNNNEIVIAKEYENCEKYKKSKIACCGNFDEQKINPQYINTLKRIFKFVHDNYKKFGLTKYAY